MVGLASIALAWIPASVIFLCQRYPFGGSTGAPRQWGSLTMGKRAKTCNIVVEGDVDLDCSRDQVLNSLELREIVFALYIVPISNQHACDESS